MQLNYLAIVEENFRADLNITTGYQPPLLTRAYHDRIGRVAVIGVSAGRRPLIAYACRRDHGPGRKRRRGVQAFAVDLRR